jgi:hypothetical protein
MALHQECPEILVLLLRADFTICSCIAVLQAGKNIERAVDDAKDAANDAYENAKGAAR